MKMIYYAHCMDIYHTEQEREDIKTLVNLGFYVTNPSDSMYKKDWETKGMDFANELVKQCDALVFRRANNRRIPSGVAFEIQIAKEMGIPIIELPSYTYGDIMTYSETKTYLESNPSEYYKQRMAERKNVPVPSSDIPSPGLSKVKYGE